MEAQLEHDKLTVNLPKLIGRGYRAFWFSEARHRAMMGGRGSKKSTTAAFWFPTMMMHFFHTYGIKVHSLVIRRFNNTHRDSTFAQLRWAINRLQVGHLWKATKSPLELTYLPSGQRIMFRGLDEPQSITSITVEDGYLAWVWWEEAFQVTSEADFNMVDLSIRGERPSPLFNQHTFTFNPWSEKHWLKGRFFDKVNSQGVSPDGTIFAQVRNYDCNEFLGADDIAIFERMRVENPRRYAIEGLGQWGIAEGLIFENWQELDFDVDYLKRRLDRQDRPMYRQLHGMDFGYTNHPTAFIALLADEVNREIFIYDEIYKTHMKNRQIFDAVKYKGFEHARICADSEDPKSIDELKELGLSRIFKAKKGRGSVKAGIQKLQDYRLYIHPRCVNTLVELNNYIWATDRLTGQPTLDPVKEYDHLMDALRYATEELHTRTFSW